MPREAQPSAAPTALPPGAPAAATTPGAPIREAPGTVSQVLAASLDMQIRWLPRATSELNAMDQLWRQTKPDALANRASRPIDDSAMQLCDLIHDLSPHARLRKAGVLSGRFWLTQ